jgi:hypothetical protein
MTSKIRTELTAVNAALCFLLTLGVLPVLVWHSWHALSGVARFSLLGFALADLALWTAARWSSTGPTALVRGVALASKAALAALLLFTAASVIALHLERVETAAVADQAAARDRARLAAIADQAERLASTAGRRVARDFVAAAGPAGTSTATGTPAPSSSTWREYLPEWWPVLGVIALPPMAGLFVLVLLSAVVSLSVPADGRTVETVPDSLPERRVGFRQSIPTAAYAQKDRPSDLPASGGTSCASTEPIQLERKRNGRVEVWRKDSTAPRGKRYLTSFPGRLPQADQQARIDAALRKAVA